VQNLKFILVIEIMLYVEPTLTLPVCDWQLLRIEEELGDAAVYAGANFRASVEPY
jgi:hypothetical protein